MAEGAGRVYTRTGDQGLTGLVGGQRVPKDDLRIAAYGTVDELNSVIGWCRAELADARAAGGDAKALQAMDAELARVQHVLFNVGSTLATVPSDRASNPRVQDSDIVALEGAMDRISAGLAPLRQFILPGGSRLNAALHVARTVCRRAERAVAGVARADAGDAGAVAADDDVELRYLNRLSDALFVWARGAALALGHGEVHWQPGPAPQ